MPKCGIEALIVSSDHTSPLHARVLLGMCVLIMCVNGMFIVQEWKSSHAF